MTAKPVSTYVNNARNEGPQCVASYWTSGRFRPFTAAAKRVRSPFLSGGPPALAMW